MDSIGKIVVGSTALLILPTVANISEHMCNIVTDNAMIANSMNDPITQERKEYTHKTRSVGCLLGRGDLYHPTPGQIRSALLIGAVYLAAYLTMPYIAGKVASLISQRVISFFR